MWPFTVWPALHQVDDIISRKRAARTAAIQEGLRLAGQAREADDAPILLAQASEIVRRVRAKQWTCRRVMEAYIRSAARAHARTNCLTEVLFGQGMEEAEKLDKWILSASEADLEEKVLLGMPVSLKDQINVKGIDSSIGFARYGLTAFKQLNG